MRLCRAQQDTFKHSDMAHLEEKLQELARDEDADERYERRKAEDLAQRRRRS
jgi:7-keto-8-aminopelargonate synthetase-like enzyme